MLARLADERPDNLRFRLDLAAVLFQLGRDEDAEALFRELRRAPTCLQRCAARWTVISPTSTGVKPRWRVPSGTIGSSFTGVFPTREMTNASTLPRRPPAATVSPSSLAWSRSSSKVSFVHHPGKFHCPRNFGQPDGRM